MDAVRIGARALGGCLGTTPEERRLEEIGYDGEGPEHDPGEPCLACPRVRGHEER